MEFDATRTIAIFVVLVAIAVVALLAMPFVTTLTVLMIVFPPLVVVGLVFLFLGVKHDEYRARPADRRVRGRCHVSTSPVTDPKHRIS